MFAGGQIYWSLCISVLFHCMHCTGSNISIGSLVMAPRPVWSGSSSDAYQQGAYTMVPTHPPTHPPTCRYLRNRERILMCATVLTVMLSRPIVGPVWLASMDANRLGSPINMLSLSGSQATMLLLISFRSVIKVLTCESIGNIILFLSHLILKYFSCAIYSLSSHNRVQ